MDEVFRQGEAVGGEYAVTGTLPSLDDVAAFAEGSARFDHGYYRFVSHPRLRRIESLLKQAFSCRHCRLTESCEIALLELLLCLRVPGMPGRIAVLKDPGMRTPLIDETFLAPCDREGVVVQVLDGERPVPTGFGRGDIVILIPGGAIDLSTAVADMARRASDSGAHVIVYRADLPDPPPPGLAGLTGARFHVIGLSAEHPDGGSPIQGGAVLGNADRVMDLLAAQLRRRGAVLSSRAADRLAGGRRGNGAAGKRGADRERDASERVVDHLCGAEGGTRAFLYASGMSAITRVLDVLRLPGKSQIVAVGHLYNDTFDSLRLAPRRAHEAPNVFFGVDEIEAVRGAVGGRTAAILTETITNPLSDVPDLEALSRVARHHGIPLVVDNTLATPENCRPFDLGADIVIHSTTKYLNGRNDHGGGAVILRDGGKSELLASLLADRRARWNDGMSPLEAGALERRLATLPERMKRFNANAARVAALLAAHPGVGRLFYNGHPTHRSHATARRILRGHGSVICFTLSGDSRERLRVFYDSPLPGIHKAPSLGSDATLLCPYTLLTHHEDSDETLAAIGLPRHLLRIAVGCEESIEPVLDSLDAALRRSVGRD